MLPHSSSQTQKCHAGVHQSWLLAYTTHNGKGLTANLLVYTLSMQVTSRTEMQPMLLFSRKQSRKSLDRCINEAGEKYYVNIWQLVRGPMTGP